MKRILATAALAVLALAGCAANPGSSPGGYGPQPGSVDVRGEWQLTGGTLDRDEIALSDFPLTAEFTNGSARIRTGCYSFDQPMTSDLEFETISFSQPTASCVALTEDETMALEALDTVSSAERDGTSLTLFGDDLELQLTLVQPVALHDIVGAWDLQQITFGDTAMMLESNPTLTVAEDGKVTGSTGCATFTGSLDIVSGTNRLGDLSLTPEACTDTMSAADIQSTIEGGFLVHYSDGNLMLISSTAETTLVYSPTS